MPVRAQGRPRGVRARQRRWRSVGRDPSAHLRRWVPWWGVLRSSCGRGYTLAQGLVDEIRDLGGEHRCPSVTELVTVRIGPVKIRSAGCHEPLATGDILKTMVLIGGMLGPIHLDAPQPEVLEAGDVGLEVAHGHPQGAGMGEAGDATRVCNEFQRLPWVEHLMWNVGGSVVAQPAGKGVGAIAGVARGDKGVGEMGSADRA